MFRITRRFENWGIFEYYSVTPKFSHVTRLDQLRASKNICWIIITVFDNSYSHSQIKILILGWKTCWMTLLRSL